METIGLLDLTKEYEALLKRKRKWSSSTEKWKLNLDEANNLEKVKGCILALFQFSDDTILREIGNQRASIDLQTEKINCHLENLENRISELEKSIDSIYSSQLASSSLT